MLVKHAARLEKSDDVDTLWEGAIAILATAGLDHAIYLTVDAKFENPHLRCTLEGLYDLTDPQDDPFLHYACESYDILSIGSEFVDAHPYITQPERDFVERAGRAGITAALGIPMRLQGSTRFGGFIVGCGLDRLRFNEKVVPRAEEIRLFCLLIHRRIEELTRPLSDAPAPPPRNGFRTRLLAPRLPQRFDALSPREREVVYLIAQGRSRSDVAEICGISIHTVSDYAKTGYRKLGVHNRAQAAAVLHETSRALDEQPPKS